MGKSTANPKLPNHHFPDCLEIITKGLKKNKNQPSQISRISSHHHGCCRRSWELSIPSCSALESTPRARQPQPVIPHGQKQEAKQSCTRSPGRDSDHPGCWVNYSYTSPAPVLEQIFASPWAFCPFTLLLISHWKKNNLFHLSRHRIQVCFYTSGMLKKQLPNKWACRGEELL